MLIEKLENEEKDKSVFVMNAVDDIFTECPRFDEYWQEYCDWGGQPWRFVNYKDADKARSAMRNGQPIQSAMDAYERTRNLFPDVMSAYNLKSVKRRRVFDESGDEADVARYMAGDSRHWGTMAKPPKSRAITIGLGFSMSSGNGESDFAENTAMGVALADALAGAGYAVQVMGVWTGRQQNQERGIIFPLSGMGKPIDEHALMAWGQPACSRHLGFSWRKHLYQTDESYSIQDSSDEWLRMAGIDTLVCKQWGSGGERQYITNVLERIQGGTCA